MAIAGRGVGRVDRHYVNSIPILGPQEGGPAGPHTVDVRQRHPPTLEYESAVAQGVPVTVQDDRGRVTQQGRFVASERSQLAVPEKLLRALRIKRRERRLERIDEVCGLGPRQAIATASEESHA